MRFFTTGIQGEETVQHWHCDLCAAALFFTAPKVIVLGTVLTLDRISVGVYLDQSSGDNGTKTMEA